jgi:hypothetical protein
MPTGLILGGLGLAGSLGSSILGNKRQKEDKKAYDAKFDPNSYPVGSPMRKFLEGATYDTTNQGTYGGTSSTTGDYGSTSRTSSEQTTNPFLTAEYGPLGDLMRGVIESRLRSGSGLPAGYEQQGIRAINDTSAGVNTALQDKLTSAGLLGGPAEAVLTANAENSRGRSIADFRSQLPLVSRQLQNEDVNMASMLANLFGKGSRTVGSSLTNTRGYQNSLTNNSGFSNNTTSGGVPPGLLARLGQPYAPSPTGVGENLFGSLPQLAMFLYGTGAFGGGKKTGIDVIPGTNYNFNALY